MKRNIALLTLLLCVFQLAHALPPTVSKDIPEATNLTKRGEAVMRFFGLKVYDIRLWTNAKAPTETDLFALELVYDLGLKGSEIAKRSIDEKRKQGYNDEAKLAKWLTAMNNVFPDVKQNDSLIGVSVPGKGARFYSQDKFIAEIADPEFAKAFFDIWLSPKSSEPKLRARLLNEKN
jgi:Chalcone isomerase-like